jgi:hypothetical protein
VRLHHKDLPHAEANGNATGHARTTPAKLPCGRRKKLELKQRGPSSGTTPQSRLDGATGPRKVNRIIPAVWMVAVLRAVVRFQTEVTGPGEHQRFHALADELIARYGAESTSR